MTRRIDFRAFDTQKNRMTSLGYDIDGNGKLCISPDIVLMQFTGLSDKNGVDIYEGDIIYSKWHGVKSVIIFLEKHMCFCGDSKLERPNPYIFFQSIDTPTIEVIGNIYENPNLIKS